jgi:hypothetical protein
MGLISDLGVEGGGIHHPQHKNRWAINFLGLPGPSHELRLQAITADRPKLEFEKIQLDRYNTRAYVAGKYTWQTISVTFEADLGGLVVNAIQAQLERQQSIIGPGAAPILPAAPHGELYKFGIHLDMLDGASLFPLERWFVEGCYLENVDWGDLDYAASETVKVVCTISYDHARQLITSPYPGAKATGGPA